MKQRKTGSISIKETALFSMFGAVMYASKALMAALPNIHLVGLFILCFTVVYRKRALIPIYVYAALLGLIEGFNLWWIPNLYIWTVLWGAVMLLPKKMEPKTAAAVYAITVGLHGFLYGTLWAPAQAVFFHLDLKGMLAWILAGFPFDVIHGISNLALGLLALPLIRLLRKLNSVFGIPA